MEWRSGRSGCKTCPWLAMIWLKRISSASSVRSLYVGTSHCSIIQVLHRLMNDSSLAWSMAEHAPDHPRCLCSLPAVDARRHPGRRGAFDVHSCHTCSLYGGTWIEMPASFVVTFCRRRRTMCLVAESDYCWSLLQQAYRYRRRHANRYIVFADTVKQRVNTHRY